jgi:NAD(P)H-hydrate repair Nnr-like enzyme with NAD(P)H-hydrate dehydratase domain
VKIKEYFSSSRCFRRTRILVVGGGTGGCSVAAKLAFRFGAGSVTVLESADVRKLVIPKRFNFYFDKLNIFRDIITSRCSPSLAVE